MRKHKVVEPSSDPLLWLPGSGSKRLPTDPKRKKKIWFFQKPEAKWFILCVVFTIIVSLAYLAGGKHAVHPSEQFRFPGARFELLHGTEVVWQMPEGKPPKAILFLAHGCAHGAEDFWHRSAACTKCTGLPEEMRIAKTALARGYMVVAVSSQDRGGSKCWNLPGLVDPHHKSDIVMVPRVIETLRKRHKLQGVPVYAMGASSGGSFVLFLAMEYQLAGVCSQIMALPGDMLQEIVKRTKDAGRKFPPTALVHMPRDEQTARLVRENLEILEAQGIRTWEASIEPRALTPSLLAELIDKDEISLEQSQAIHEAFLSGGIINDDGMLLQDPRHAKWRHVLREAKVPGLELLRLQPDLSPISEVLNVLWAYHEIVSSTTAGMLDFFEGKATSG